MLAGDWLTNLAIDLNQCSHAALDAVATELAAQPITRPTRRYGTAVLSEPLDLHFRCPVTATCCPLTTTSVVAYLHKARRPTTSSGRLSVLRYVAASDPDIR